MARPPRTESTSNDSTNRPDNAARRCAPVWLQRSWDRSDSSVGYLFTFTRRAACALHAELVDFTNTTRPARHAHAHGCTFAHARATEDGEGSGEGAAQASTPEQAHAQHQASTPDVCAVWRPSRGFLLAAGGSGPYQLGHVDALHLKGRRSRPLA